MYKLAVIAVAGVALATPVMAQDTAAPVSEPAPVPDILVPVADLAPAALTGADVIGADGEELGRITQIVFTSMGEMEAAVVSTGGFLGFGRHSVAIPVEDLTVSEPADQPGMVTVKLPLTLEELKAMPEVGAQAEEAAITN
jgi:PRC-barrel domain protein